jgi:hypothetical protein
MNKNSQPSLSIWALTLGATGFAAGFFGPIALNPDANQGPLLGIFITGPGGLLTGALLGVVFKWLPIDANGKWLAMLTTSVVGGIVILYFCLPEPKVRGYVIDGRIANCAAPVDGIDAAIKHWDQRIAAVTWAPPRAGWKNDVQRMLRDEGVVIEIQAWRQSDVLEHRKPWNSGQLSASKWQTRSETKSYFANFAGSDCTNYRSDPGFLYVATGQGSKDWPPSDLQNFLELALIERLPEKFKPLLMP